VRSFISAAFTTIRCSQVESRAPPSKLSIARNAETKASWTASAASSSERSSRRATASIRPPWVRTSSV